MQSSLSEAERDFRILFQAKLIPPLVAYKLMYLKSLISNQQIPQDVSEKVPSQQRQNLQSMPHSTKIQIFITTVSCLSGKEITKNLKDFKAYLIKQGKKVTWQICYLSNDSQTLLIANKKQSKDIVNRFKYDRIWVSKQNKKYEGKYVFAFYYDQVKYVIGFDNGQSCNKAHKVIKDTVQQRRQWLCTTYELDPKQQQERHGLPRQQIKSKIIQEQRQYLQNLQNKVDTFLLWQQDFKLHHNTNTGRILYRQSDSSLKATFLIQGHQIMSLVQKYTQIALWNSNVASFSICNKARDNHYVAHMVTKAYSFMSYPRQCYLGIAFFQPISPQKDPNSAYLLIQSIPNELQPAKHTKMQMKQLIEFLPQEQQNENTVLINVYLWADFKGYASVKDNLNMTLHLFNGLDNFDQHLSDPNQVQRPKLFSKIVYACQRNSSQRDVSVPGETNNWTDSVTQSFEGRSRYRQNLFASNPQKIISAISQALAYASSTQLLAILQNKQYLSYYLKHKFTDNQKPAMVSKDNSRFWQQQNRWKFKGQDYVFVDQKTLNAHKSILKIVLKQIAINLAQGKSIINMSLPVEIFSQNSLLDYIADGLGFASIFMKKAAATQNLVQQMKYVICSLLFISTCRASIEKPFNPILGQTYQGSIDGVPVYLEQISHHPPISAYYIAGPNYRIWGNIQIAIDMGLNVVYSRVPCWINVQIYPTKTNYVIRLPQIQLGGLMYGERTLKLVNRGYVLEKNNSLFCQYSIGKTKKKVYESSQKVKDIDTIGGIFKVTPKFKQKMLQEGLKKGFSGLKPQDIIERLCLITGKWYGDIYFDNQLYKSLQKGPFPSRALKNQYLLPSDSLFRQDVIHKMFGNNGTSNQQKQRLQNLQRKDRKLREQYSKR